LQDGKDEYTVRLDRIRVPDGLVLRESRKRDVVAVIGEEYSLDVVHLYRKLDGFNMSYPMGVSFHFSIPWHIARRSLSRFLRPYDEARGILSSVSFSRPFPGRTKEGIGFDNTLADVIASYGDPKMREVVSIIECDQPGWSDLSSNVYACYNGIQFHVPRVEGCRIKDIDAYLQQSIVAVTLYKP